MPVTLAIKEMITTFSRCLVVTSACKGTLWSKLVKLQNLRVHVILNPQALSSALALLGHHSTRPSGYKFHRPLGFEV